jgi:hypothetical protein
MSSEETKRPDKPFDFHGAWMPGADPLLIGGKNFASLGNMVPDANGLCGCLGYTKVTTAQLAAAYRHARSGIQLRTKDSLLSGVFVQAVNDDGTGSAILQQLAQTSGDDVPNVQDFETTPLHVDAAGASLGRFSVWPLNQIAYCNSLETLIYAGPEISPAKFILADGAMADTLTNPVDYTEAMLNNFKTPGNAVRLSGGPDAYTKVLLHHDDQPDGSVIFTDSSGAPHAFTAHGDAVISTQYPAFGIGCGKYSGTGWIAGPADLYLAATPFTLRMTISFNNYPNDGIGGQYVDANNYWYLRMSMGRFIFMVVSGGVTKAEYTTVTPITNICINYDVEIDRWGENFRIFINGVSQTLTVGTAIGTNEVPNLNAALEIGRARDSAGTIWYHNGLIDEFQLSPGIARHTVNFSPPTTTAGIAKNWTVFTTRPIQAVKYYLNNINSISGAAITGRFWDGTNFATLIITDGTNGLTVDEGVTSFASTVGIASPKLLEGSLYYVYQFELSAGDAEVYRVTVDSPLQPVADLWDGVLRPVIECRYYHGAVWIDATMNVAEETAAGVTGSAAYVADVSLLTNAEYIDIATSEKACAFKITMYERETGKVNINSVALTPYYWNGAGYVAPQGQVDGTSRSVGALNQTGYVSFTSPPPGREFQKTERDATLWRYRLKVSATLSAAVWIDKIEAIPASQLNNLAYKFPFMFQNRAMLCNLVSTGEGNRVDYPLANSTEGWNGEDSSLGDGKGSLYIGGQEELTCACEIYNRLGSSIYTFGLFFKAYHTFILNGYDFDSYKDYPLNDKVGCPAPETLDTYTIFTSKEQQSSRSIAAWLSYIGPYMFDAGGLTPLPGIECYFDKTDPRCINFAAIDVSRGWFDPDSPQYNLQIPSGAGQTINNVWLIYDFRENKWYPKIPTAAASPYLCAAVRVADAKQKQYIYGFRENGYVMRLEYGTTWDGEPIAQHIETGEILAINTIWDIIKMQLLKVVGLPLTGETPPVNLIVTIYKDGAATGDVIATIPLSGANRYWKFNDKVAPGDCWSYRLRFATQTSNSLKGMQLLIWGEKYSIERPDNR